jgi:hypothetical protein
MTYASFIRADEGAMSARSHEPLTSDGHAAHGSITSEKETEMATTLDGYTAERGELAASYATYDAAQRAVDYLSDAGFPVEYTEIVGLDVRLVERVTGRLTKARAAAAGAGAGAWFGLFIGVLVGLFTTGPIWLGLTLGGLLIGALWGALFGYFAHWATHGRRDFASTRGLAAGRYEIRVDHAHAEHARELLAQLR